MSSTTNIMPLAPDRPRDELAARRALRGRDPRPVLAGQRVSPAIVENLAEQRLAQLLDAPSAATVTHARWSTSGGDAFIAGVTSALGVGMGERVRVLLDRDEDPHAREVLERLVKAVSDLDDVVNGLAAAAEAAASRPDLARHLEPTKELALAFECARDVLAGGAGLIADTLAADPAPVA